MSWHSVYKEVYVRPALHNACSAGHADVVRLLVRDPRVDVNLLEFKCYESSPNVNKRLKSYTESFSSSVRFSAIGICAESRDVECLRALLGRADLDPELIDRALKPLEEREPDRALVAAGRARQFLMTRALLQLAKKREKEERAARASAFNHVWLPWRRKKARRKAERQAARERAGKMRSGSTSSWREDKDETDTTAAAAAAAGSGSGSLVGKFLSGKLVERELTGAALIGRRIKMYRPKDDAWFDGTVRVRLCCVVTYIM